MSIIDYNRIYWQDLPSLSTAVEANNLNKMDKAIDDIAKCINKTSEYVLLESAWVDTGNSIYPYKLEIASDKYSSDDVPICEVWGTNEIETADELTCIGYVQKVIVGPGGVVVYASNRPTVNLKLVLKV